MVYIFLPYPILSCACYHSRLKTGPARTQFIAIDVNIQLPTSNVTTANMQTKAVVAAAVLSAGTLVASLNIITAFPPAVTTGITGSQVS